MVDFQSRTSRTRDDNEDDPEEEEETGTSSDEGSESEEGTPDSETTEERTDDASSGSLSYAIVTVTGQRSFTEDTQGDTAVESIEGAGNTVTTRDLIQPSYDGVQSTLTTLAKRDDVDVVIAIGGTGIEPTDVTVEALDALVEKRLPGFGELFRRLAYEDRGTEVVGTRTTAGVIAGTPVFSIPGTIDGVVLAVEEIILPESPQLVSDGVDPESTDQ